MGASNKIKGLIIDKLKKKTKYKHLPLNLNFNFFSRGLFELYFLLADNTIAG